MVNYFADHELAAAGLESSMFANLDNVRDYKPGAPNPYDVMAAHLDGSDPSRRIGTAIALSVMAGDKFDISATSYFASDSVNMQSSVNPNDMMNAIISALAGGVDGYNQEATNMNAVDAMFSSGNYLGMYQTLLDSIADYTRPLAFINYQVYDAQMNLIPSQSGAIQVSGTADSWQVIGTANPISITQNGYLSVYMSNADYMPVYMDKLNIAYYKGRLVQEQHYYPFGLSINEGTASGITNQYQYQGKKLQDELGLNLYDFHARQYDAQIGRFWGVDPADQFPSGYTGQGNDPANNIDPTGMFTRGPKSGYGQRSEATDVAALWAEGSRTGGGGGWFSMDDIDMPGVGFKIDLTKGTTGFIDGDELIMDKGSLPEAGTSALGGNESDDGGGGVVAQTSTTQGIAAEGTSKDANATESSNDGDGDKGNNNNSEKEQDWGDGKSNEGKGNSLRGGPKKQRDNDLRKYPKEFGEWYHDNKKDYVLPGQPDPNLEPIYQEWLQLDNPSHFTPLLPTSHPGISIINPIFMISVGQAAQHTINTVGTFIMSTAIEVIPYIQVIP